MKILKIYFLDKPSLTPEQGDELKNTLGLDAVIHVKAENQITGIQYPVFEFETIEG